MRVFPIGRESRSVRIPFSASSTPHPTKKGRNLNTASTTGLLRYLSLGDDGPVAVVDVEYIHFSRGYFLHLKATISPLS